MNEKKELDLSEEEKSFINFQIGVNYYYKKKYEKAIEYFEVAWPYLKKAKIPYNKIYASIVVSYYDVGEKEKAREIVNEAKEVYKKIDKGQYKSGNRMSVTILFIDGEKLRFEEAEKFVFTRAERQKMAELRIGEFIRNDRIKIF